MYIGDDAGKEDVPEPIAFMETMFALLAPTRMPISSPFITASGPRFIDPMFMPGIVSIGLDEGLDAGLADGIGMFIWPCGVGEGEAAGICMPGIVSF
jgi:hypothetical protein